MHTLVLIHLASIVLVGWFIAFAPLGGETEAGFRLGEPPEGEPFPPARED